uniref:InlB B-repeat-containing protein n=1 Tax=uncultured Tenacibaculum sp. TaxID=174713 RepID=UPI00262BE637
VTAVFSKIQHTLTTNATNGTISRNPNTPTAGTYDFGTDVVLTATPNAGYQFDGWSGDASGTTNPLTITMDADKTVTAVFSKIQHTLTTNATNGTISRNPNTPTAGTYDFGTDVVLTATPNAGYQFDGWSGDASGTINPLTITMDADKTVTAVFSKIQHTLTTNATNGTISRNPNTPTAGTYDFGTDVVLTATPNAGYQFDGWSGDASGTINPLTITMDADKTVTAVFSKIQHTLTTNATNGTISRNPNTPTAGTYDFGTDVVLTATPNAGYQFDGWSGDASGTTNPLTITMDADKTVTAVFSKIQHTLTTNATNGTISRNPNTPTAGTYDFGTDVVLTATPNAGYQFDGWSGDASGTTNPLTITMDADKTVTAVFSKIQHTLTTNATNGTIARNPNTPTAGTYDFGTDVVLTATPNAGYQFDGWSGDASGTTNPLTITMDADKTVTAVFSKIQHTLTTNATNGTISRNPNTPTAGTYDFGTDVVLTATPNAGYQFDGWSGDASGTTNPLTITMDADKTVTAVFSKIQHTLTTNATNGTISTNPNTPTAGTYDFGTDVVLTATPNAGYQFDGWSGDASGTTNPLTITMDADKTLTAVFSKIQHTLTTNATNGTISTNPNTPTAGTYDFGTDVILTATPNAGYQFDGWSGDASGTTNPLTITMDADKTVTAVFSKIQHTLTTNATNGTISTNPNTPTAGTYDFGTDVVLTATPNAGYQFDGWSGDASGTTNPLTITMDADKTVTAIFIKSKEISVFANGFTSLEGIAVTTNNEVYVSEHDSGKIYKIDPSGTSTEFAASGFRLNDIAFNGSNTLFAAQGFVDDIMISDATGNLTEYVDAFNKGPYGITFYNNELYYTSDNGVVYKIDINKNETIFADGFFSVAGIDFDSKGNAYVADRSDRKLFKIATDGTKTTIASGSARIIGVEVVNDIVYYTSSSFSSDKIVKYNPETNTTEDYVTENLDDPRNLEADYLGNMYITNGGNGTVVKVFDENLKRATNSINDEVFNSKLKLYPNPANDVINIINSDSSIIKQITLVDVLGKEILKTTSTRIDISDLPNAVYLVKIKGDNNKIAIKKIIKN